MPTNDWWSAIAWSDKSFAQFPHPLAVKPEPSGLRIALPKVQGTKNDIFGMIPGGNEDAVIGHSASGNFPAPVIEEASDWFITVLFADAAAKLRVSYGHGSPFVFARYEGGAPRLRFASAPRVWSGDTESSILGVTFAGKNYGVFAPTGSRWQGLSTAQWDCITDKTYLSVAVLPDDRPETLALFSKYAHSHVTGTEVSWRFDPASAVVTTQFRYTTEAMEGGQKGTLFALYPHQWRNTTTPLLGTQYASVRGPMRLGAGEGFATKMTFPGILPVLPDTGALAKKKIVALLKEDAAKEWGDFGDTYWEGKQLGRLATLIGIADAYGLEAEAERLHTRLAKRLEGWFSAVKTKQKGVFAYEPQWGTLIGYPASFGSDDQLNDHHFHYGYFLRAAAEIARRDPAWASEKQWGSMLHLLVRDIASPDRNDPLFPFLRTFDPYAGHTWASGHARFGDGNNNESSSEAMNAWAGVALLGEATGDRALRDLGIWLYTTELHAIEENWFNVHGDNFPTGYEHPVVTMVWGGKGVHSTWFSANPESIHGINWLPITGASLYLGRWPEYCEKNYRSLLSENLADDKKKAEKKGEASPKGEGSNWDAWPDIMRMYRALSDPADALAQQLAAEQTGTVEIEAGNSRTNLYHWLHTLKALGRVDRTVTADATAYAVFKNDSGRSYVAWNLGAKPLDVTFSDGTKLKVPPANVRLLKAGAKKEVGNQ